MVLLAHLTQPNAGVADAVEAPTGIPIAPVEVEASVEALPIQTLNALRIEPQIRAQAAVGATAIGIGTDTAAENQPGSAFADPLGIARLCQVVAAGFTASCRPGRAADEIVIALSLGTASTRDLTAGLGAGKTCTPRPVRGALVDRCATANASAARKEPHVTAPYPRGAPFSGTTFVHTGDVLPGAAAAGAGAFARIAAGLTQATLLRRRATAAFDTTDGRLCRTAIAVYLVTAGREAAAS